MSKANQIELGCLSRALRYKLFGANNSPITASYAAGQVKSIYDATGSIDETRRVISEFIKN